MPDSLHSRHHLFYPPAQDNVGSLKSKVAKDDAKSNKRAQKVIQVAPKPPLAATLHAAGVPKLYDPGYANTISCTSSITLLDGPSGILRYRGYPIESLASTASFDEVAHLILYASLPSRRQLTAFRAAMAHPNVSVLPPLVAGIVKAFPTDAHPMTILVSSLAALTAVKPELNPSLRGSGVYDSDAARADAVLTTLGIMPTLAAQIFHHISGNEHIASPPASPTSVPLSKPKSYTQRFFDMVLPGAPAPFVEALDTILILHADHEQNCSTAAVRHLSSSGVDVFSALSAGAAALYGPSHGGACEAVVHMLQRIGSVSNIPNFLARVKDRKERLMGFGHRVYKTYDPRARIVHRIAHAILEQAAVKSDPLFQVASVLEQTALTDSYFTGRKLYPNVDFYSGIIYKAMGIQPSFFTVLFALGRCVGWLAHWLEYLDDPDRRIARPHQRYTGSIGPLFVPTLDERAEDFKAPLPWETTNAMARL